MSVPTTNLYDFVHQVLENQFLIKYFYPWGCKEIENIINGPFLVPEKVVKIAESLFVDPNDNRKCSVSPVVLCHDQEPLDFDYYKDSFLKLGQKNMSKWHNSMNNLNLRWCHPGSLVTHWVLLHSELNSDQVQQYEDTGLFKCAYWWSHAMISRDWYRFAEHDQRLLESHNKIANWLVYAHGVTGKREYRKGFLKQLKNINNVQLGSINTDAVVNSNSSAEYNFEDFTKTNCSIVLETVYDGRIHLTEKTLRPIACGHPFIILNGSGTLNYLRSYGFKTFHPFIDESYDLETDSNKRMSMVLSEMDRINKLSNIEQERIWKACAVITKHNKNLFFSDCFFKALKQELYNNIVKIPKTNLNFNVLENRYQLSADTMNQKQWLSLYWHLKKGNHYDNWYTN